MASFGPARPARVAIVGTGNIADGTHLPALRSLGDRVTVVAALDTDAERLSDFVARHSIPAARTDLGELLEIGRAHV